MTGGINGAAQPGACCPRGGDDPQSRRIRFQHLLGPCLHPGRLTEPPPSQLLGGCWSGEQGQIPAELAAMRSSDDRGPRAAP